MFHCSLILTTEALPKQENKLRRKLCDATTDAADEISADR